jgi:hypothetical protein
VDFKHIYAQEPLFQGGESDKNGRAESCIGLAFSGGGIRSATFNLGILQGMARRGLLKHVDYLSTVSGGGYIGAWYMAFLKRQACNRPERAEVLLNPEGERQAGEPQEHPSITWLRRFSNYLTPKTGLSGDTLTLVATYLRNLLLNLIVTVAFLCAVLLLPHLLARGMPAAHASDLLALMAILPLLMAVASVAYLLTRIDPGADTGAKDNDGIRADVPWWDRQVGVLGLVVLPVLFSSYFMAVGVASPGYLEWAGSLAAFFPFLEAYLPPALVGSLCIALTYTLPWLLLGVVHFAKTGNLDSMPSLVKWLSSLGASILAGVVFYGLAVLAQKAVPAANELVTFGPPLVLLAYMLPVTLHIGLARRHFSEMQREWWARLGGWLLVLALVWTLLCTITLFGPTALGWLNDWVAASGGLAWLGATLWGVLAGKSATSGKDKASGMGEILLRLAPWVFLLGLLGLLSLGLQKTLEDPPSKKQESVLQESPITANFTLDLAEADGPRFALSGQGKRQAEGKGMDTWIAQARAAHQAIPLASLWQAEIVLLALFALFGIRIDINLFSFHNFYRNRLTRCYLGASRYCGTPTAGADCRDPNPFTGFDPRDDLAVSELGPRPYPLFNTALNLVGGEELAWQQRKAAAFCIAPGCSGYQFPPGMADASNTLTYGPTDTFLSGEFVGGGGVRVGTAMAISGAAVNPNMGFHSSPAVSFLLTVFNVRLGRWVGNPDDYEAWCKTSPDFGVRYLFFELFGMTSARRTWFNLSDGGHFENLGLYELVRRRLPYIIASDAAEDADYHFDDLANAIRKIRADFGIDIEIDVSGLRPQEAGGQQRAHAAVGAIRYDRVDPRLRPGVLVYIRPGLTGNEPTDVQSYARRNPPFPFQSTADQFFDEAQFESYRQLGLHIAKGVFEEAAERHPTELASFNPEAFFTVLKESWRGRLEVDADTAAAHHNSLDELFERLRKDPDLAFLSAEIFPEWPDLMGKPAAAMELPAYEEQRRSGFYVCRETAQLMERVYQDLDLENQYDHPDSRGWMNLFRHWSWSPMFRATYAITAATLSERFQRFCKRRLDLDLGDMEIGLMGMDAAGLGQLNFVERGLAESLIPVEQRFGATESPSLCRFEMVIRYPAMEPGATDVELLRFHFGFALLRGDSLVYFRIQDHLRRMGLARQAMCKLVERVPGLTADPRACAEPPPGVVVVEEEKKALQHLFKSVRTIRDKADPVRI